LQQQKKEAFQKWKTGKNEYNADDSIRFERYCSNVSLKNINTF